MWVQQDGPGYPQCPTLLLALRIPGGDRSMTDDQDDQPDHVGTAADETPFDHGCDCPVCNNYRKEVRAGVTGRPPVGLSEKQHRDLRRLIQNQYDGQTRIQQWSE